MILSVTPRAPLISIILYLLLSYYTDSLLTHSHMPQGVLRKNVHSQVDYLPLSHQGNPREVLKGPRLLAGFSFPGPGLRVQGNLMALASEDGSLCLPS